MSSYVSFSSKSSITAITFVKLTNIFFLFFAKSHDMKHFVKECKPQKTFVLTEISGQS